MQPFAELGTLIEQRWRKENYSEPKFPEIAAEALAEAKLVGRVDPWEIIRWVQGAAALPDQKDVEGRFGNPPITLFAGPRFYIDVYFWLDGTTSIHQHGFCGAFQVLLGSSIHSHYSFRVDRVLSEHFSVGELILKDVQLLKLGDIKKIWPGHEYIHALFHLDRPSATITIRTEFTPSAAVQYDYRKPHFALNPFFRNAVMSKKLQTVGLLLGMKHSDTDAMIGDLFSTSDFHTAYFVLESFYALHKSNQIDELFGMSTGLDRFDQLLAKCRSVHGDIADLVLPVMQERDRQNNIISRRSSITGDEHRFFLALLLNVPGREKIFGLVKERFPERDPVETILDWVEELSNTKVLGSKEPNALGIPDFDDAHIFALECLLKGLDDEDVRKASTQYPAEHAAKVLERVPAISESLVQSPLFKSMLAN